MSSKLSMTIVFNHYFITISMFNFIWSYHYLLHTFDTFQVIIKNQCIIYFIFSFIMYIFFIYFKCPLVRLQNLGDVCSCCMSPQLYTMKNATIFTI